VHNPLDRDGSSIYFVKPLLARSASWFVNQEEVVIMPESIAGFEMQWWADNQVGAPSPAHAPGRSVDEQIERARLQHCINTSTSDMHESRRAART
jgi:hypothetical protein